MPVEKIGYKAIFNQKEYMKMIIAALINRFGDSIDAIAFTWIVYEITGNAVWSAIVFGVNRVPSVLITPFAGAWVEGRNKKRILVVTDIIRACCVAIVATGYLMGFLEEWMLVLFLCAVAVFLNAILVPFNSLQAPLSNEILGGGAEVLSILGIALTLGMVLGSAVYPTISKRLSAKSILFASGMVLGLYYVSLILCKPFYGIKWFMYIFVFVASGIFGFVLTIGSSLINVEFVKRTDEKYLARAASFLTAFSVASIPIAAFLISGVAVFIETEWIFVGTGVIDIVVTLIMYRSKVLDMKNEQSTNIGQETVEVE